MLDNSVLMEAMADIESLGVQFSESKVLGTNSYAIISGRSNSRWWLIPLKSRELTISGLALFQPLLASARLIKIIISWLSQIGLRRLWIRSYINISGNSILEQFFKNDKDLNFAYFTGTDSPHRKIAIQIMDDKGNIKGYAKFTRNKMVGETLIREATFLNHIQKIHFKSAIVPKLIFIGIRNNGILLVTDTVKNKYSTITSEFSHKHYSFINELTQVTSQFEIVKIGEITKNFNKRIESNLTKLGPIWEERLKKAAALLEDFNSKALKVGLTHGDFTPWNMFIDNKLLYVFDWEYAESGLPFTNDVFHFLLNEPKMRKVNVGKKIQNIFSRLIEFWPNTDRKLLVPLMLIYLLTQSLRQIERIGDANTFPEYYLDTQIYGDMLDFMIGDLN